MWTAAALSREAHWRHGQVWRVVEAQHRASTRRITRTLADQQRLEELLEETKPPFPPAARDLHYLLKTPFRYYPPRPHGSRFRPPNAPWGVFYGSEERRTGLAEFAYHRLRFFLRSRGTRTPRPEERLTVFQAGYRARNVLDLTRPPLDADRVKWTDPDSYAATQELAVTAREAGIAVLRSESARDPERGANLSVFDPAVFTGREPTVMESWNLHLGQVQAVATRALAGEDEHFVFEREAFGL